MKYENPIIRGFNPDPSVCRVGEDFYLVTSSFEYFPGIPIYHSKDLVNWKQIGNCIERPEQLPFEIAETDGGIWAPTIRFNNGRFYVTAKFMKHGCFIVSSKDPSSGWSDPVTVDMKGIDPSILFDEGRAYYCTNQSAPDGKEAISLAEVNADTGELLSDIKPIWSGMSDDRPQYLEAPHIYHIGDWYYLFAAEGGTGFEHMITAARSNNIWGPYEDCSNSPLLTNRYNPGDTVACSGHGDLFDDANGNWWVVHLATRPDDEWYSHMGRETFLLPVIWNDELPYIADGRSHIECDGPLCSKQRTIGAWQADFNTIEPQWLFLRKPHIESYMTENGSMIIKPTTIKISDNTGSPTFLAVRQKDIDCTVEADMEFVTENDGDEAGIAVYISNNGYYSVSKRKVKGKDHIVLDKNGECAAKIAMDDGIGDITFRIEASKRNYEFYYSTNGCEYVKISSVPVLSRADAGKCFTGTLIGIYAQCEAETGASARVTRFYMK